MLAALVPGTKRGTFGRSTKENGLVVKDVLARNIDANE
jgi:hypothetical protein